MAEKLDGNSGVPEVSPRKARAAEAAGLIAAGEIVDKPTVPLPEGFNVSKVVRLPDQTPEELENARKELEGPKPFTSPGQPRQGASPVHEGGKRRRRGFGDV